MIKTKTIRISPADSGRALSLEEFRSADYEPGWRYELIHGVLVVSRIPKKPSRAMGLELAYRLQRYRERRRRPPEFLTVLVEEEILIANGNVRRCDLVIWIGLGHMPSADDLPTIAVEFVSERAVNHRRDYVEKRADYLVAGVREYWIIDRFRRTLTVLRNEAGRWKEHVVRETETYSTPQLPGFKLDLASLLGIADAYPEEE
jgi:Uma2 family endonuclease